jgi:hypothetical protein
MANIFSVESDGLNKQESQLVIRKLQSDKSTSLLCDNFYNLN